MIIGGMQRFSLSEFPGRIAAIVFLQGCNLRCPYCHNPELVDPDRYSRRLDEESVVGQLARRAGLLQGVVITGGEPTLQEELEPFIERLRGLGLAVKLDTNGTRPGVLRRLVERRLVSHVGLDVKAPLRRYRELTRSEVDPAAVEASLGFLVGSRIPHEVRTTWLPGLLSYEDMLEVAALVRGSALWAVQRFVSSKALDPAVLGRPAPTAGDLARLRAAAEALGVHCVTR